MGPQASRFTISFWSWTLSLGVAAIFLLVPLAQSLAPSVRKLLRTTPLVPSDALVVRRPLTQPTAFIGNDCTACSCRTVRARPHSECEKCHADVQHMLTYARTDVALFDRQRCAQCHSSTSSRPRSYPRERSVHGLSARLDKLNPTRRSRTPPNFGPTTPNSPRCAQPGPRCRARHGQPQWLDSSKRRRSRNLAPEVPHAQHLNPKGLKSPTGERVLQCGIAIGPTPAAAK